MPKWIKSSQHFSMENLKSCSWNLDDLQMLGLKEQVQKLTLKIQKYRILDVFS